MNKVIIEMDTGNGAFTPDVNYEVARILGKIAGDLRDGGFMIPRDGIPIRDINGNQVGRILYKRENPDKLKLERIREIQAEIETSADQLLQTYFEGGGRITYYQLHEETIDYLEGLLVELNEMKGDKIYE